MRNLTEDTFMIYRLNDSKSTGMLFFFKFSSIVLP